MTTNKKQIWFDMDGTIADLYGNKNWLEQLRNYNAEPYANAKPLLNMQSLARVLNRLRRNGYEIGIISWLSKNSTPEYDVAVTKAKKEWLGTHLKSVKFDHIDIVAYGTPKSCGRTGILFDDEIQNRENWKGTAFDVNEILEILKAL